MARTGRSGVVLDEALAARVQPVALAETRRLPVLDPLAGLLPGGGLRRGSTCSVDGAAATSLALALTVAASRDGAWVAAVGFPSLGLAAAAELGVALERLVLVADPVSAQGGGGAAPAGEAWSSVLATVVDAFDLVMVRAGHRVRRRDGRRLVARTRERGGVLIQVGGEAETTSRWPEGADVRLRVRSATWEGLGVGHGHLRARRVQVEGDGRRDAARPRLVDLWLPDGDGGVGVVYPDPVPLRGEAFGGAVARGEGVVVGDDAP